MTVKGHFVGTWGFVAPEGIKEQDYNEKCDIFSVGNILFMLLTSKKPFRRVIDKNLKSFDLDPKYSMFLDKNDHFWEKYVEISPSNDAKQLLSKMLTIDKNINSNFHKRNVATSMD